MTKRAHDDAWRWEPEARRRDASPIALPRARATQQLDAFTAAVPPAKGITPRARNTDPQTSHDAAMTVERKLRQSQLAVLSIFHLRRGQGINGLTDEEMIGVYTQYRGLVARGPGVHTPLPLQSVSGLRTRRAELVALGYLRDSSRREHMSTGRNAIVWELVRTP